MHFAVVLACLADGMKLHRMFSFERKMIPNDKFFLGVVVHVNPKRWMNEDGILLWMQIVWKTRRVDLGMFMCDSFSAHLID